MLPSVIRMKLKKMNAPCIHELASFRKSGPVTGCENSSRLSSKKRLSELSSGNWRLKKIRNPCFSSVNLLPVLPGKLTRFQITPTITFSRHSSSEHFTWWTQKPLTTLSSAQFFLSESFKDFVETLSVILCFLRAQRIKGVTERKPNVCNLETGGRYV